VVTRCVHNAQSGRQGNAGHCYQTSKFSPVGRQVWEVHLTTSVKRLNSLTHDGQMWTLTESNEPVNGRGTRGMWPNRRIAITENDKLHSCFTLWLLQSENENDGHGGSFVECPLDYGGPEAINAAANLPPWRLDTAISGAAGGKMRATRHQIWPCSSRAGNVPERCRNILLLLFACYFSRVAVSSGGGLSYGTKRKGKWWPARQVKSKTKAFSVRHHEKPLRNVWTEDAAVKGREMAVSQQKQVKR
jgi:hypothetical protein